MVNDFWHTLALIENAQIFAWEHICFEIDTVEETIGVARNGKLLGLDIKVPGLGDNKPAHLQENLVLGIFDDEEVTSQFSGQVTNLNMYSKKQGGSKLIDVTAKPCKIEGDLLSWGSTTWTDHGAEGSWEEVDETVLELYLCSPFSSWITGVQVRDKLHAGSQDEVEPGWCDSLLWEPGGQFAHI